MKLSCSYEFKPRRATCNTSYICSAFGIEFERGRNVIARDVEIDYEPGQIVLFTGPSGSGKSSLLRAAARQEEGVIELNDPPESEASLIDTLGDDAPAAVHLLSLCGLAEAMLMLRTPGQLSDGQRYRYAIARCLAAKPRTIVADEWCAKLDRVTAKVVSHNARKIADRTAELPPSQRTGFLVATTHDDIIDDLQPDTIVRCLGDGTVEVERKKKEKEKKDKNRPFRRTISFLDRLGITEGAASDWPYFARWHYRGHGLGPVRSVRLLWHDNDPIGICIFGFGPLSSSARNRAFGITGSLSTLKAKRINRNFATVSRLVLDPRYRGAGLAAAFLRACCRLAPWPWIELVSEMAALVPFCQAAGFRRIAGAAPKGPHPPAAASRRSPWGKSGWTRAGFASYSRRVRFSRPAYFLLDNRRMEEDSTEPEPAMRGAETTRGEP